MLLFDTKDQNFCNECAAIGAFYLQKNKGNYDLTEKEIESLHITNLISTSKLVIIYLSRPGLLIGKRGENVEKLQKWLGKDVHIAESNHINDFLIPYDEDIDLEQDFYNDYIPAKEYDSSYENGCIEESKENIWEDNEWGPSNEDFGGGT